MKWLLLIMLIACGKHQEPKAVDQRDSDGDQILNNLDADMFVAEHAVLKEVSGTLKIYGERLTEVAFQNTVNPVNGLFSIVKNEKKMDFTYFTEWSTLGLAPVIFSDNATEFKLEIITDIKSDIPDEVIFGERINRWKPAMVFKVKRDEVLNLLSGKQSIVMRKLAPKAKFFQQAPDESIRSKTYRVVMYNGNESKVYYVSNELGRDEFLKKMEIKDTNVLNETEIFYLDESDHPQWFIREVKNHLFIARASSTQIKQYFLNQFEYKKTLLRRENGTVLNHIEIKSSPDSRVYFKARSLNQKNLSFSEEQRKRTRRVGGGGRDGSPDVEVCTYPFRMVSSEKNLRSDFPNVMHELELQGQIYPAYHDVDEKGFFWSGELSVTPGSNIKFKSRPESTYTTVGNYSNGCWNAESSVRMNSEAFIELEIETYVEKI